VATHITDPNGHIHPYVRFEGGRMRLTDEGLRELAGAAGQRGS